jgi:hypothetical protein
MRLLFHIFSLGEAQTPVALSAQSVRKASKNPAKQVFLVFDKWNDVKTYILYDTELLSLIMHSKLLLTVYYHISSTKLTLNYTYRHLLKGLNLILFITLWSKVSNAISVDQEWEGAQYI